MAKIPASQPSMSEKQKRRRAPIELKRQRRNAAIGFTVLGLVIAAGWYIHYATSRQADLAPSQAGETKQEVGHSVFDVPVHGQASIVHGQASIVERRAEQVDPSKDDWQTEVATAAVNQQLARLKQYIERWPESDEQILQEILSPQFQSQQARPESVKTVFKDEHFHVRRSPGGNDIQRGDEAYAAQPGSFRELIQQFLGADKPFQVTRCSF